ncbi:MAG TPA: DUF952 domain-containing protein [Balneolaceae bacterium]|nr:DUF952 domain-containing protein [Balneolaceae bacterium]
MRQDILFHITTREAFSEFKNSPNYEPESLETEGFIHCSSGAQINETANRLFAGLSKILLLVIDVSTLRPDVKYELDEETGQKFPHIYGPLNKDSIMDKIDIPAEDDGSFNISFKSYS